MNLNKHKLNNKYFFQIKLRIITFKLKLIIEIAQVNILPE
jgi:hypothetical protein